MPVEIQPPNREIPKRIRGKVTQLEREGAVALYVGNYIDAVRLFRELYGLLFRTQKEENRPIHKGAPLYNLGITLFAGGQTDQAIYKILLAYVEDTLNVGYDLEDNADRAPAANMLRAVFYLNLRILREIKILAAEIKASGQWNMARDPEPLLKKIAKRLKFDINRLSEQCERGVPQPGTMMTLGLRQPPERRVFIGTNYDSNPGVIPIAKEGVFRRGYEPVIVSEAGFPPNAPDIHDKSLMLLHTCKWAIIDVTHPGGQFIEVERTRDYGVKLLLVRQALDPSKPPPVSAMVSTIGHKIEYYKDPRDLIKIIAGFLP